MKNKSFIEGRVAHIVLRHRDGSESTTIIDAADMKKADCVHGAWSLGGGYVTARHNGAVLKLAHVIAGPSPDPDFVCDHINRIKTDNRFCNLRWVPRYVNVANRDWEGVHLKGRFPTSSETLAGLQAFLDGEEFSRSNRGDGVYRSGFEGMLRRAFREYFTDSRLLDLRAVLEAKAVEILAAEASQ